MSSSRTKLQTFFPNSRKEVALHSGGTGLLADKRINLAVVMPLADGRILGMPGWLSDEYVLVSKEDGSTERTTNMAQLEGVEVSLYANDTQQEPILKLDSCSVQKFQFVKGKNKKNGALGSVNLHFNISTISFNKKLWDLIPDYNNATLFAVFSGTQMTMSFGKPREVDSEEVEGGVDEPKQPIIPGTVLVAPKPMATTSTTRMVADMTPNQEAMFQKAKANQKRSPAAQHAADVLDGRSTTKDAKAKKSADAQRRTQK